MLIMCTLERMNFHEGIRSQNSVNSSTDLKHTLEEDLKNYESKIDQTLDEILAGKEIEANKSSVDIN